jgi:hypothetical protein
MSVCQNTIQIVTTNGSNLFINGFTGNRIGNQLNDGARITTGARIGESLVVPYTSNLPSQMALYQCDGSTTISYSSMSFLLGAMAFNGNRAFGYNAFSTGPIVELFNIMPNRQLLHSGFLGLSATSAAVPLLVMSSYDDSTTPLFVAITSDSTVTVYNISQASYYVDDQQLGFYGININTQTNINWGALTDSAISHAYGFALTQNAYGVITLCPNTVPTNIPYSNSPNPNVPFQGATNAQIGMVSGSICNAFPNNVAITIYPSSFVCTASALVGNILYLGCNSGSVGNGILYAYSIREGTFIFSTTGGPNDIIYRMVASNDQTLIFAAHNAGNITVWNITSNGPAYFSKYNNGYS